MGSWVGKRALRAGRECIGGFSNVVQRDGCTTVSAIHVPTDVLMLIALLALVQMAVPVKFAATLTRHSEKMSQWWATSLAHITAMCQAMLANQGDMSAACNGRTQRVVGSSGWRFVGLVGRDHRHIGLGVGLVRFGPLRGRA